MKKRFCLLLVCALLLALAGCGTAAAQPPLQAEQPHTQLPTEQELRDASTPQPDSEPEGLRMAKSYEEVFTALEIQADVIWDGGIRFSATEETDGVSAEPMASAAAPVPEEAEAVNAGGDYSETNVQVAGIDEGDIVKTDGECIYVLRDMELIVFRADGAATQEIFRTKIGTSDWREYSDADGHYKGAESMERYPQEMYVFGGRLAVVLSYSHWKEIFDSGTGNWSHESERRTEVALYDVTDAAAPRLLTTVGQDGSHSASRLKDGTLYLISRHWLADKPEADDPGSFVPALYRDGAAETVACGCIWLQEQPSGSSYTVVTAFAMSDGARQANLSLLGGSDTVYMSHDDLYITRQLGGELVSEPRTEGVYTVTEHSYAAETELIRISLADGGLRVEARGTVDGYLLNQFSLDAYDGYLRVVTTSSGYSYTIYEDEAMGFINHVWPEEGQRDTNNLFVLDAALNVVGSITDLAEDERVYSVRFDGDIGYFVTFRQTDPLFAVDLSEPTVPRLLSALKIPGFSQYLHVYGEGRLFGLGMDADEETGWTETMKLSMFDTADPTNVTEKHTLVLDGYWSEALHNHRAILIASEKDIIAFPSERGYVVYGYSDAQGFYLRAEIEGAEDGWWYGNARGLYIGDYAYVVARDKLWVLDLEQLSRVETLDF